METMSADKPKLKMKRRKKVSIKTRKRLISSTLEGLLAGTKPKHRQEIAEHILDTGIDLIGAVTGVDTSNAIVITPDDAVARLLYSISQYSRLTGVDEDSIVENLLETLGPPTSVTN